MKKFRVLQLHSRYSGDLISGENSSVQLLHGALENIPGIESVLHEISTSNLHKTSANRVVAGFRYLTSDKSLVQRAKEFDVVILHNAIPFFSSRSLRSIVKRTQVVFAWHNTRRLCIAGSNYYQGRTCFDCEEYSHLIAIVRKCYRKSVIQSILVGLNEYENRKTARRGNLHHLVFSKNMVDRIKKNGLSYSGNIYVLPHYIEVEFGSPNPGASDYLAVGRLDKSKGFTDLVESWNSIPQQSKLNAKLHIVGVGEELKKIESQITDDSIVIHGRRSFNEIREIAKNCRVGIVPSVGPETFGRVVIEFMALGLIPIVRPAGALADIVGAVETSWVVADMSILKLRAKIEESFAFNNVPPEILHEHVLEQYGKKIYIDKLNSILKELGFD